MTSGVCRDISVEEARGGATAPLRNAHCASASWRVKGSRRASPDSVGIIVADYSPVSVDYNIDTYFMLLSLYHAPLTMCTLSISQSMRLMCASLSLLQLPS